MHELAEKIVHLTCRVLIGSKAFPSLDKCLLAESHDFCKLVNSGCVLSHKPVEDGCKATCVKFGG